MNCLICNNVLKTGKKFCSYECRNKSYEKIVNMTCEYCNKTFSGTSNKMHGKNRFCSQECTNEWKSVAYCGRKIEYIKVNCLECGKQLERAPCKVSEKNFCDKKCACKFKNEKMLRSNRKYSYKIILNDGKTLNVRSRWEGLFVLDYLEKNNLNWTYEPKTFKLSNGSTYTPDFYVEELSSYVEIKGYDYPYQIENRELFMKEYSNLIVANETVLKEKFNLNTKYSYTKNLV